MLLLSKNDKLYSAKKRVICVQQIDRVETTVYCSETLKRGFYGALFLAEMVNIVGLSLGVFRFCLVTK